jgi:hypothetical protein
MVFSLLFLESAARVGPGIADGAASLRGGQAGQGDVVEPPRRSGRSRDANAAGAAAAEASRTLANPAKMPAARRMARMGFMVTS